MGKKTDENIEKALKAYGLAEEKTDGFLRRLSDQRYSLLLIVVAVVAGLVAWWLV